MNVDRRIDRFDIAKAILIFIVVFGHTVGWVQENGGTYNSVYVDNFIFTFHVPAFFIITGVLFNDDKWKHVSIKTFVVNRIQTLIVPYLFFELWDILIQLFVYKIGKNGFVNCLKNMLSITCNAGADWFLIALFIGEIMYFMFIKYDNKALGVLIQIVCFLVPVILPNKHIFVVIGRCLIAYAMIMIGSELRKNLIHNYNWKYIIFSLFLTIIISLINKDVNVFLCKINNPILFVLGALSGTYFVLGMSEKIHSKLLLYIGKNTLIILGTHQRLLFLIPRYFPMCGNIMWIFIDIFIVFVFEIPFIFILNKFFPFFVGKHRIFHRKIESLN